MGRKSKEQKSLPLNMPQLVTVPELAEMLRISMPTINRRIRVDPGSLPRAYNFGTPRRPLHRFLLSDVKDFMNTRLGEFKVFNDENIAKQEAVVPIDDDVPLTE